MAFEADDGESIESSSRIVFRHVTPNTGNGFRSSTGIFTAPYAGLYLFAARICEKRSYTFSIHKDGYIMIEQDVILSDTTTCHSVTRVIYLDVGDMVDVHISIESPYLKRYVGSTFSGYLIK